MSNHVDWTDPYGDRRGRWYKGNLHAHTSPASECGQVALDRVLKLYAQAGYDFLAISDHMALTEAAGDKLAIIPGLEWNSAAGEHTGIYALDRGILRRCLKIQDHRRLLKFLAGKEALVVLNHPNWQLSPHYRREQLRAKGPYDGIEVYNFVIERLQGCAISTDKWDDLLAGGRGVLGLASDDSHIEADIGGAAVFVRARRKSARDILDAIRRGNFYCSCGGMRLSGIRRLGDVIAVAAEGGQEMQAVGEGGRVLARVKGPKISFDLSGWPTSYVRFTAYGPGSSMAWTQPFFKGL